MRKSNKIGRGSIVRLPARVSCIYRFPNLPMKAQALDQPAVVLSRPAADRDMVWLCTVTSMNGVSLLQQSAFHPTEVVPIAPSLNDHHLRGTTPKQIGDPKDKYDYNLLRLKGNDQMIRAGYVVVKEVYCAKVEDLERYAVIDGITGLYKYDPGMVDDVSMVRLCRLCSEKNPGWYPWSPWP